MRQLTDETALLREAIKEALGNATEPMTSTQVADTPVVMELGLSSNRVSRELKAMHQKKKSSWPIKRIPSAAPGHNTWEYFNPDVVKLVARAPDRRQAADPAPVNGVNPPPAFEFNPVEFEQAAVADAATGPEVNVPVPPGVKSITMTVAGVTIKIDLA